MHSFGGHTNKHGKTYIATTHHFITCRLMETRDEAVNPDEVDPSALSAPPTDLGLSYRRGRGLGPYGMPIG